MRHLTQKLGQQYDQLQVAELTQYACFLGVSSAAIRQKRGDLLQSQYTWRIKTNNKSNHSGKVKWENSSGGYQLQDKHKLPLAAQEYPPSWRNLRVQGSLATHSQWCECAILTPGGGRTCCRVFGVWGGRFWHQCRTPAQLSCPGFYY